MPECEKPQFMGLSFNIHSENTTFSPGPLLAELGFHVLPFRILPWSSVLRALVAHGDISECVCPDMISCSHNQFLTIVDEFL